MSVDDVEPEDASVSETATNGNVTSPRFSQVCDFFLASRREREREGIKSFFFFLNFFCGCCVCVRKCFGFKKTNMKTKNGVDAMEIEDQKHDEDVDDTR